jgi:hypothetical protein
MRLIDADQMAFEESEAYTQAQTSGKVSAITFGINSVVHRKLQQLIVDAPTVDAVEVVRCKECKYLMFSDMYGECGRGYMGIVYPNDFCSCGERKDGADDDR